MSFNELPKNIKEKLTIRMRNHWEDHNDFSFKLKSGKVITAHVFLDGIGDEGFAVYDNSDIYHSKRLTDFAGFRFEKLAELAYDYAMNH